MDYLTIIILSFHLINSISSVIETFYKKVLVRKWGTTHFAMLLLFEKI